MREGGKEREKKRVIQQRVERLFIFLIKVNKFIHLSFYEFFVDK